MSLLDSFLLDPFPLDVWITPRTDGILGSGTEDDPFDGSRSGPLSIPISSITSSGTTTATVTTAVNHGFSTGTVVQVEGATGPDANLYNGVFSITYLSPTSFRYTMISTPVAAAMGNISCQLDPFMVVTSLDAQLDSGHNRTTTAIANTAGNHGFSTGDLVMVVGAQGPDATYYNGTFAVTFVTGTSFSYITLGITAAAAAGMVTCRRDPYRFDAVMRSLQSKPPTAVRLGPGIIETRGYSPNSPTSLTSWTPASGMKILGSGMEVTTLKLVRAMVDNNLGNYVAIGTPYTGSLFSFEAADFTVDCNVAGQPSQLIPCGAIGVAGTLVRLRHIRAINFGTQTSPTQLECFVLGVEGVYIQNSLPVEGEGCLLDDCILEQPGLNNALETTCLFINLGEYFEVAYYHHGSVIRNCVLNCEYRDKPAPISQIVLYSGNTFQVTTRLKHNRADGDWVRISGVVVSGSTNNSFNGSYQITRVDDYNFRYTPNPAQSSSPTQGDMWVGKFSSQIVEIIYISKSGTGPYTVTVTTLTSHFRVPGGNVLMLSVSPAAYSGSFVVTAAPSATQFQFQLQDDPGPWVPNRDSQGNRTYTESIGVSFQGVGADIGTAAVVEGNRVSNCLTGGPYHDTYDTKDQITRNNYYRGVTVGPFQSITAISYTTDRVIPLKSLTTTAPGSTTALATTYVPHGFVFGDPKNNTVIIAGATGADAALYNGTFVITAATATTFNYTMTAAPGGAASGAGYGTAPYPQRILKSLTYSLVGGVYVATGTVYTNSNPSNNWYSDGHGLVVGDIVYISKANFDGLHTYTGYFPVTAVPATDTFQCSLPSNPFAGHDSGSSPSGYFGRTWTGGRQAVERNIVEIWPSQSTWWSRAIATGWTDTNVSPAFTERCRQVLLRGNVIRHVDGGSDIWGPSAGIEAQACGALIVGENIVDIAGAGPIGFSYCGATAFFSNQTPAGGLLQGLETVANTYAQEVPVTIDDASILAL